MLLNWIRKRAGVDTYSDEETVDEQPTEAISQSSGVFSTQYLTQKRDRSALLRSVIASVFRIQQPAVAAGVMDAAYDPSDLKSAYRLQGVGLTDAQLAFYGAHSFIGYQMCALLAQNWLINKCCMQPAKDAIRNGYKITANSGIEVAPDVLAYIEACDKRYDLTKNLVDLVYYSRVFGIRIAKFDVDSTDNEYYEKPFNPDGITPGSYRGITQIDPYWITPELNGEAASNPDSRHFYEPTFWRVNGKRIHRSHLIIVRGPEVPDILKPTYLYGGLSVPQMLYERVYAAERTANEAPMLAQSKRETVIHVDVEKAIANQAAFESKMQAWTEYRNNWGVKVVGTEESIEQFETSLADLDTVIMTQYQLVAAIANVPVTKLLGTVPKGFNATGEYDESSYHETLESIQTHDLQRLIERHHLCVMRSEVRRKFPEQEQFEPVVTWEPLDAMTAAELAEVNLKKAQTAQALMQVGAIDGIDERNRLINDPDSGYNGMESAEPELVEGDDLEP